VPTKLAVTQQYDAPPDRLFALFCERSFIEARLEASGGLDPQIMTMDVSDTALDLVTRQGIPAEVLPSIVSSFISGNPSTQRTENWRAAAGGYVAELRVTIHGAPASLKGSMTLAPRGNDGSTLMVNADAVVGVPIFGGKIEKVIVEQLTELLDKEAAFTAEQLAED
jgi:Protein of unknown function (DUF2505)